MPFAPAALCAAAIWIVGGIDNTPSLRSGLGLDKVAHFGMYGLLGWLLGRAWFRQPRSLPALPVLLLPLLLGAADELRQQSIRSRSAEIEDWLADAAGALTGAFLAMRLTHAQRNERHGDA